MLLFDLSDQKPACAPCIATGAEVHFGRAGAVTVTVTATVTGSYSSDGGKSTIATVLVLTIPTLAAMLERCMLLNLNTAHLQITDAAGGQDNVIITCLTSLPPGVTVICLSGYAFLPLIMTPHSHSALWYCPPFQTIIRYTHTHTPPIRQIRINGPLHTLHTHIQIPVVTRQPDNWLSRAERKTLAEFHS